MIGHSLGNIWHELFLFLPKFHGFVLYLRRILQKVICYLIPIGMVMVLTFKLLPGNRRKWGRNIMWVFLIGNRQYLDLTASAHGMLCSCSKSKVQLQTRVHEPQITKAPKIWGSSFVHMLLLSFTVCLADARNRLYNMLYKQIGRMIFVLKRWQQSWTRSIDSVPALRAARPRHHSFGLMSSTKGLCPSLVKQRSVLADLAVKSWNFK